MIQASLERMTGLVPHLRWRLAGPDPGGEPTEPFLPARELVEDPDRLRGQIAASAAVWDSQDPQVLVSLWWQAYAYRVAGTTLACWVLDRRAPEPSIAAGTGVWIARSRPSGVVYPAGAPFIDSVGAVVEALMEGHLDQMADRVMAEARLGRRLVWGNAAAGIAAALSAVATAPGAPDVKAAVDQVMERLPHDLGRLGSWSEPWSYRRTSCCLWWKTSGANGALCQDCSLR